MILESLRAPGWLKALWEHGQPKFANISGYAGENASVNDVIAFGRDNIGGAFTWDEIARFRDRWKKPFVLKGILHPADAERAVSLGVDGIWISNHGGRQIEALPGPIDVLPAIAAQVGARATVLFDSGVRSGLDVVRALALGAEAAFAGKAFLWGLGALGAAGPRHVIDLITDETRAALGQIGAMSPEGARSVVIRHPGAISFPRA
jgi:L-lactate dehydrogenase (cytochrome)